MFGKKDVELRAVKPQWKNSKLGDIAINPLLEGYIIRIAYFLVKLLA